MLGYMILTLMGAYTVWVAIMALTVTQPPPPKSSITTTKSTVASSTSKKKWISNSSSEDASLPDLEVIVTETTTDSTTTTLPGIKKSTKDPNRVTKPLSVMTAVGLRPTVSSTTSPCTETLSAAETLTGMSSLVSDIRSSTAIIELDVVQMSTPRAKRRSNRAPKSPSKKSLVIRPGPTCSLKDTETEGVLFYGSEEDESDDEEAAAELVPITIPRVARLYFPDDDDEVPAPVQTKIELSWPPTCPVQPVKPEPAVPSEEAMEMEPISKFDFRWTQIPSPQTPPELRREMYNQNKGPVEAYVDPYAAFVAIWDRPILEHIVSETNKYASQLCDAMIVQGIAPNSRITKWVDTSVDELYTYFGIILATGIVIKSRLEEYWSTSKNIFCTPEFSAAMSYDRFFLLSKCLHFNDNSLCTAKRMCNSEAKLHKLLPILQHLNDKFSSLYVLGQNIALDESLTKWTGCLNIRQHIRNKAATVGIKTYEICESETGYLWRFEVEARQFTSDKQDLNPLSGKIPSLVLRLLHGLEHKGHTVWMDNYYNSPALARELKLLGFDCVGTLRSNRQNVPAELTNLLAKDLAVGQICGCTSGDVDLIVWRDRKPIALISTYHGLTTVECGDRIKPSLVADYNNCMGGVDKKDQMLAMYPIERNRSRVWYKKFFKRLLNASTLNAFILLRATERLSHRQFRKTLVLQLLERHNTNTRRLIKPTLTSQRHMPQLFGRTEAANAKRRLRRKCVVCSKRTSTYCEGCQSKALCVPECFSGFHK